MISRHSQDKLEYHDLLESIADYSRSVPGQQWLTELQPCTDKNRIESQQALFRDAVNFLRRDLPCPEPDFEDVRHILEQARPVGSVLAAVDIRACLTFLSVAGACRRALKTGQSNEFPRLTLLREGLQESPALQNQILAAVDEEGAILNSASPALQKLRRQIHELEKNIHDILQSELNSPAKQGVFQDRFITVRNGRYVVPVVRNRKAEIKGVVHDHSNSGQTLFIELAETLPLANRLTDARLEEEDECRRIRKRLTEAIRECLPDFFRNHEIMEQLDAAFAVARWACEYECVIPSLGSRLALYQGRHPLLQRELKRRGEEDSLVPLTIEMEPEFRTLLITGSNSGGKTVAVKTAGLLLLAAQSGLPIPLEEKSELPVFSEIFVDIGDEQSLSENLSTFTGHVKRISGIIEALAQQQADSTRQSLIILDELGTGTDPVEGAAIACAVLEKLNQLAGITLATTHLSSVKHFVHNSPGMQNAGVRFNPETLQPEYKLELGTPASSHALETAERTGLQTGILQRARDFLDKDHLKTETLLNSLHKQYRELENREAESRLALDRASRQSTEMRKAREEIEEERRRILNDAYREARRIVNETREQMDRLFKQQRHERKHQSGTEDEAATSRIRKHENALNDKINATRAKPRKPLKSTQIRKGLTVWVESLQASAAVQSLPDKHGKLKVNHRGLEFEVGLDQLGEYKDTKPYRRRGQQNPAGGQTGFYGVRGGDDVSSELNLIGLRTEEASRKLDKALNNAVMANLQQVRIIHGFGSGRLRQAVHEFLRESPLVSDYRTGDPDKDAGGGGVTIVELANSKQ